LIVVAPRNIWDGQVSSRVAIVDAQFKMCMHNDVRHICAVVEVPACRQDRSRGWTGGVTVEPSAPFGQGCCGVIGVRSGSSARIRS